jgi:glycosyltransferase involved in cell wall biosynthesis
MTGLDLGGEKFDVTLSTLNCDHKMKECMEGIIGEIPVNKIIVVDGGSTDRTLDILKEYPQVELHDRPDLNLGQSREFAFSRVETEWFVQIDSDVVLRKGWFDKMIENRGKGDVVEGGRIEHYAIPLPNTAPNSRAMYDQCMIRKKAVEGVKIDCLHCEEELTRRYMESRGFKWYKHGELLADHYSMPVRYDAQKNKVIITRQSFPDWSYTETGRIDAITGITYPAAVMKMFGKAGFQVKKSLIDTYRAIRGSLLYINGYRHGRKGKRVVEPGYKLGVNYILTRKVS